MWIGTNRHYMQLLSGRITVQYSTVSFDVLNHTAQAGLSFSSPKIMEKGETGQNEMTEDKTCLVVGTCLHSGCWEHTDQRHSLPG